MEALTGSSNSKRRSAEDAPGDTLLSKKRHQRENDSPLTLGEELLACLHDVSHPEGYVAPPPRPLSSSPPPPAKVFEFTLDPFQSEAIKCLESGESVMVYFSYICTHCLHKFRSLICLCLFFWCVCFSFRIAQILV